MSKAKDMILHILHCGINFLTLFVSVDLIYLRQIHHFFLITAAYQFQHHHSLLPSLLHFFILASRPFFSINPTLHRPLVPPDWFHGLLDCLSAFLAQRFYFCFSFFRFHFSKSFSSSVVFSSLLLSTPIFHIIGFLMNQPHYHFFLFFSSFFSFFLFS